MLLATRKEGWPGDRAGSSAIKSPFNVLASPVVDHTWLLGIMGTIGDTDRPEADAEDMGYFVSTEYSYGGLSTGFCCQLHSLVVTKKARIYTFLLDGVVVAVVSIAPTDPLLGGLLNIGGMPGQPTRNYHGFIVKVGVYARALDAAEQESLAALLDPNN